MHEYRLLHDVHLRDQNPETRPDALEYLRHAVPAANNLSFALEVHLKVLQAQRTGHYPHGHSIRALFNGLSDVAKNAVYAQFAASRADDKSKYITEFSILFRELESVGSYAFTLKCADEDPPDASAHEAIAAEIETCDRLYLRWRYLYERGIAADQVAARFHSLIHLNRSIAVVIESFEEGVIITGQSD